MTLIMAWREQALQRVWIVSDSRLSSGTETGRVRLTDSAAKILSVPVVLRRQSAGNALGVPVRTSEVTFTYAGSSLIALQSYTAILTLWRHLMTSGEERLPTVQELAEHLSIFVFSYTKEVSAAHRRFQPCQCALIGFQSDEGVVDGWSVEATFDNSEVGVRIRQMNLEPGKIDIFGSGTERAFQLLKDFPKTIGNLWCREPLQMIRHHLQQDDAADVGGGVQLGYIDEAGSQIHFDVQPDKYGGIMPNMRYRGFDFTAICNVGNTFVSLQGLA
jgi:hypothetical protein